MEGINTSNERQTNSSNNINFYKSKSEINLRSMLTNVDFKPFQETNFPNKTEINKENNKMKTKGEIENLLKEVLYNSLAQAIIKIILTPHLTLKIFLFICVCVLTGYSSYSFVQSFMNYFMYSVSIRSRVFHETPTLFPEITFCNFNIYQTQYAFDHFYSVNPSTLSIAEKKMLGHNLNKILIYCKFNDVPCNSKDFVWLWDDIYGNCYKFNSGHDSNGNKMDLKNSSLDGTLFGLQLTIYVNVYEELIQNYSKKFVNGFGAVIRIGNSSYSTFYSRGVGILVSAGTVTYISVDREFKSMLPKPYSNCEIDSSSPKYINGMDLYNLILQSKFKYTQQLCFRQCFQNFIFKKYNCSYFDFLSNYNVTQCTENSNITDFFDETFVKNNCLSSCPLECDQTLFYTSISSTLLNGYNYIPLIESNSILSNDFINRTLDAITVRESFVQLYIYYESLSYTLTEELPQMDAVSLLGSIGGNLGLFLGVSFFSLCEIVEVAIEIFFILKQKNR